MICVVRHYGYVAGVVGIERNADLEITVDTPVGYAGTPGHVHRPERVHLIPAERHLAAYTAVIQSLDTKAHLHPAFIIIKPPIGYVQMCRTGLVPESVSVHVVIHKRMRRMRHQDSRPLAAYLQGGRRVKLPHQHTVDEGIEEQRLLIRRLAVLDIDLAGYCLHSVDDRRGSLGYLNALQPLPGDVGQAERGPRPRITGRFSSSMAV